MSESEFRARIGGVLMGTALGDGLGFVSERLSSRELKKRFGKIDRFRLAGRHGFVTDDTEQTALVAASLARHPENPAAFLKDFRRGLLAWYFCFPFGIGRATIQSCLRIALGFKRSGVNSAGNGAAMRAAVVGAFFYDDPQKRKAYGEELARVTHCDPRAVEGALFVAELAAGCLTNRSGKELESCFARALDVVQEISLRNALEKAAELAGAGLDTDAASSALVREPCAFILNSLPFSTFCLLRYGDGEALECLSQTIAGGGDTDTNAAIVGAWLGALKGGEQLPADLIADLDDGPFGPRHLSRLTDALVQAKFAGAQVVPGYSLLHSAVRNLFLVPVILAHFLWRLLPVASRIRAADKMTGDESVKESNKWNDG
jgi:ADP-ribosyl-[dinitrogen reductase] hydrolase